MNENFKKLIGLLVSENIKFELVKSYNGVLFLVGRNNNIDDERYWEVDASLDKDKINLLYWGANDNKDLQLTDALIIFNKIKTCIKDLNIETL